MNVERSVSVIFVKFLLQLEWMDVVVNADSIDIFKTKLDKYWNSQAIKYDYLAALTGIGNRSEYSN